ncbi:MAG: ABC transporter permease [Polyangiaceae bacterium]
MLLAFTVALRAIVRNGLRAGLTVLGILIGVFSVVVMTGLGTGARTSVSKQIEAIGSNFIIVSPENANVSGAKKATGARLTEEDGRAIKRDAVSVRAVAPVLRARAQVAAQEKNWSTSVVGSTTDFFIVRNWALSRGAIWTASDELTKSRVCVIGKTTAQKLFGNVDPVDRTLRIGRHSYRVLGLLESKGEAPFGGDQDDVIVMPIGSMRARVSRTPPGFVGVLMLSATSAETSDRAVAQIDALLRQRHHIEEGKTPDFSMKTQKEFQAVQGAIYGILTALLVIIAAVSLVVGGIGVMNIMLVSVTERTREIGIRMAIGARASDIQVQFLIEAICLSTLGGALGAGLGVLANALISRALSWQTTIDPIPIAVSIGVSAAIGIGFGYFPARRAALLDPITALRHE